MRAAKATALGALFVAAPVATGAVMGANAVMRASMPDDVPPKARRGVTALSNTLLCVLAGGLSAAYGVLPVALGAAAVCTWVFGGPGKGGHGEGGCGPSAASGREWHGGTVDERVIIDVQAEDVSDA